MQAGLIGLPQAGKKTLFRLLTKVDAAGLPPSNPYPFTVSCASDAQCGVSKDADQRKPE